VPFANFAIPVVHQTRLMKAIAILSLATVPFHAALASTTITQWTFEGDVITPATGSGTASLIGSISGTFAAGSGGGRAWNTSNYQSQGTGSGAAGVQFLVSTSGFSDPISVSFDHRASGTASRWARVDYTLDSGANWVTDFWNNNGGLSPHDNFYAFSVNVASVPATSDNSGFGFRIVSIFSPDAFNQNSTLPFGPNTAYMRANAQATYPPTEGVGTGDYSTAGTWRFDNVTVNAVPEPASLALSAVGLGLGGLGVWRRRRSKHV
jgi:hypothetical protein